MKNNILAVFALLGWICFACADEPSVVPETAVPQDQIITQSISPGSTVRAGTEVTLTFVVDVVLETADEAKVNLTLNDQDPKKSRSHIMRDLHRGAQRVELSATFEPQERKEELVAAIVILRFNKDTGLTDHSLLYRKHFIQVVPAGHETPETVLSQSKAEEKTITSENPVIPPPERDTLTMAEVKSRLVELDGKVIPAQINYVSSLKQVSKNEYYAHSGFYKGIGALTSEGVLIPQEGKEVFNRLSERGLSGGSGQVVYLYVRNKMPLHAGSYSFQLQAVGLRYRANENKYKW